MLIDFLPNQVCELLLEINIRCLSIATNEDQSNSDRSFHNFKFIKLLNLSALFDFIVRMIYHFVHWRNLSFLLCRVWAGAGLITIQNLTWYLVYYNIVSKYN